MNDHVSEQKYFHEVNCIFKRLAVLQTLSNKDVIVEYLSKQAWGFLCVISALPYHFTLIDPQSCPNTCT